MVVRLIAILKDKQGQKCGARFLGISLVLFASFYIFFRIFGWSYNIILGMGVVFLVIFIVVIVTHFLSEYDSEREEEGEKNEKEQSIELNFQNTTRKE